MPCRISVAAHRPSAAMSPRSMKPAMSLSLVYLVETLLEEHLETGERQLPVAALVQIVRHPNRRCRYSARQQSQHGGRFGALEQEVLHDHRILARHAGSRQQNQADALR